MRKPWLKGLPLHGMTLKDAGRTGSGAAGPQMGADLGEVQPRPPPGCYSERGGSVVAYAGLSGSCRRAGAWEAPPRARARRWAACRSNA